jgi:hypothetical protein
LLSPLGRCKATCMVAKYAGGSAPPHTEHEPSSSRDATSLSPRRERIADAWFQFSQSHFTEKTFSRRSAKLCAATCSPRRPTCLPLIYPTWL